MKRLTSEELEAELRRLVDLVPGYPISAKGVLELAKKHGFSFRLIRELKEFCLNGTFASRDDLLTRCFELDLLEREERLQTKEVPRNPQG